MMQLFCLYSKSSFLNRDFYYFYCQVESATQRICHVTPGDAVKNKINFHSARLCGRESKSSDEISSSSDESLSTDAGHLSLKPYA